MSNRASCEPCVLVLPRCSTPPPAVGPVLCHALLLASPIAHVFALSSPSLSLLMFLLFSVVLCMPLFHRRFLSCFRPCLPYSPRKLLNESPPPSCSFVRAMCLRARAFVRSLATVVFIQMGMQSVEFVGCPPAELPRARVFPSGSPISLCVLPVPLLFGAATAVVDVCSGSDLKPVRRCCSTRSLLLRQQSYFRPRSSLLPSLTADSPLRVLRLSRCGDRGIRRCASANLPFPCASLFQPTANRRRRRNTTLAPPGSAGATLSVPRVCSRRYVHTQRSGIGL